MQILNQKALDLSGVLFFGIFCRFQEGNCHFTSDQRCPYNETLRYFNTRGQTMGKNSVFWKWMVSYMVVMLVFLLCNSITYWQGKRILVQNQETENDKIVEQIRTNLTDMEETMRDLSYSVLAQDDTILLGKNSYHGEQGSTTSAIKYSRYTLCELLKEYQKINGNYAAILLYFANDDYIVASDSANTAENYWRAYQSQYGGISREDWERLLAGDYDGITMQYGNGQYVFFAGTIQDNKWDRTQINIFFVYELSQLQRILFPSQDESVCLALEGDVFCTDQNAEVLSAEDREQLRAAMTEEAGSIRLTEEHQTAQLRYYEGGNNYKILICRQKDYFNELRGYQGRVILILVSFTAIGILLMLYFLRRNYSQVAKLLDRLDIKSSQNGADNEFQLIDGYFHKMQQNLKETGSRLQRQNLIFQKEYLEKLLRGNLPENADYVEEMCGIRWCGEQFTTLLFYMEEIERDGSEEWDQVHKKQKDLEFVQFIVENVSYELFQNSGCIVYPMIVSDVLVIIVNFPEKDARRNRDITLETVTQLQEFMDEHMDIRYTVAAGEICRGREGISDAYQQAIYTMETKRIYELDDTVFYEDVKVEPQYGYYYPLETERELIWQIRQQNVARTEEIISDLYQQNEHKNISNRTEAIRYLEYDLQCSMLKAMEGTEDFQEYSFFHGQECHGKQELIAKLHRVCENLQKELAEGSREEEELCNRIVLYIQQNIADCNLNVTSIAEHFQISSVQMSKTFRSVKGQKLPTYISQQRIQRAKEILSSSDDGLNEVAEKSGFGSVRTLLRSFKQSEGMTPSQWKDGH